ASGRFFSILLGPAGGILRARPMVVGLECARIIPTVDQPSKSLELRLSGFVEALVAALPKGKFPVDEIAGAWAREISAGTKVDAAGRRFAPDQYTLSMHPKDYESLTKADHLSQTILTDALRSALQVADYQLSREPHITLATDPTLPRSQMRVIAWHSSDPTEPVPEAEQPASETPPKGAFFIVDGSRHFPLDRTLINIGRRLDNQLVLEDPHISRRHAQLRVRGNRYVLYDLNSIAGTRVNGKVVQEWVLRPGDVVTLATVQLIYGEDPKGPPEVTPPYKPPFKPGIDSDKVTPLDLTTIEIGGSQVSTKEFGSDPSAAGT
ncbi:MAG: FhaA domain-containing protein, partial [Chloroflexota bacterium]